MSRYLYGGGKLLIKGRTVEISVHPVAQKARSVLGARYYPTVRIGEVVAKGIGIGDASAYPTPVLALASAFEWLAAQLEYPTEYFNP